MRRTTVLLTLLLILSLAAACHRNPKEKGSSSVQPPAPPPPHSLYSQGTAPPLTQPPSPKDAAAAKSAESGGYGFSGGLEGGVAGGTLGGSLASLPCMSPAAPSVVGEEFESEEQVAADEIASATLLLVMEEKRESGPPTPGKPEPSKSTRKDGGGSPEAPPPPATQGTLRAQKVTGEPLGDFPLRHTEVTVRIGGYLARTTVRQEYANPYSEVIEAVYVFPLGAMAAVNDFVMEVGGRKIVGIVRPRAEAEQIYKDAKARGQTASLLTQERPNIFTQNVANIEPGGKVAVTLTTFERLSCEQGRYEYVFPMVVGPRYIPGAPAPAAAATAAGTPAEPSGGWSPPTTAVPDADRITPPVLKPGERCGTDIGLTVELDAGIPLRDVRSVAHAVDIREEGPTRRHVVLSRADSIPNRDFVLRWSVDASKMQFGVLPYRDGGSGYFTLMVQPPLAPDDDEVTPREITFILDVSGSMSGLPVETSKSLVRQVLDRLRPDDVFNVFIFAGNNGQLWEHPQPNTSENVSAAKRYLDTLSGGGGTEMLAGVRRALKAKHDPRFLQMYVFATDGFVGDEERILALVKEERGEARFFAFGIGSSVNRFLIDGIGKLGGGRSAVVLPRDEGHASRAAQRFFECIDSPVLVDARVDWNGLPVKEVYPSAPGDLFAGGTLDLVGRYTRAAEGTAYLVGRLGAKTVRIPIVISLPERAGDHAELAPVWARYKIQELTEKMLGADDSSRAELVQTITDLAVAHKLASAYTAFVAVDESRTVGHGRPLRVMQPVEMPEGVSYEGIFGEPPSGRIFSIEAWGLRLQSTRSGALRVATVAADSAAERLGVKPGATLKAVGGTAVHDANHLEGLVLQSSGRRLSIRFDPGGEVFLPVL